MCRGESSMREVMQFIYISSVFSRLYVRTCGKSIQRTVAIA